PEQKIMLGRCYGDDGNPAYGAPNTRIAKVRVHSEALDAAGVLANYEAEKADFGPPPAPKIEFTRPVTPIVFGAQDPGAGPTAKAAVTIKNTGLVALPAGFQVAVSGANAADFVLDAPVTTALDAGESRSFAVAFDPSDSDPKTGAVTVSWLAGAAWSAGSASVQMYGNNKVVYIDQQNGSDSLGLGTFESPWQTIAKALASTLQGDMIMLEPGVYPCDDGAAWGGRVRQLKSTEGASETTIQGGDHWWIGWTTAPTGLSFEGITFAPRLAGSGTCWLRNGTLSAFSLKLVDCVFTGNWGWDYTLHLGVGGAMLGELIAERTTWSTPDDIAVLGDGQTAGCAVTIKDCAFDGCRHALSLLGRNAVVAITGSTIERTTNHGINIYQGTDLEAAISNCTVREAGGAGINIDAGEVSTITLEGSTVTGCTMAGVFFRPYIDGTANVPSMTITGCAFADNCRSTNDTFAAQGDITCNGWDNVNNVPAGAILIDRCWVGSIAHRALLPLNQGIVLIDADVAIVRNSVVEGGYRGIAIPTADNRTKRIEHCTLIGTDEASADDINPDTTAAVSHKDSTGYGEGLNAPVVVNCIVLGYDALDTGTEWDAASSNNIAFVEGDPALVDPKLAFQAGAPFARPGEISPLDARNDYRPAAGSPAIGAGVALAEVTVDFDGVPRPVPPSIGAFEGGGGGALVYVLMGNVNTDNKVDIADAIALLGYLFGGGTKPAPQCAKAADANDDDKLDIADAIKILGYLFSQQPMLAPDHGAITAANNTCTGYPADGNDGAPFFPANVSGLPPCAVQCQ
ncbi:MAG TPA: hypothetical protein DCM87_15100, partial [Planctomycetes bacterium]|nr:hypothetical protein [Planctomycetota bacterium]